MSGQAGYDYIIVGAGSAGGVLAGRLTEDPAVRVLLLEAGGMDRDPLIHIPLGLGKLHDWFLHDWRYETEPIPGLNGRRLKARRGKVLGGSSSINVMAYTRGHRGDYDRWAANGAPGWSFPEVLPYFKRCESWEGGADEYRGGDGPVGTQYARTRDPLFDAWIEAGKLVGFPHTPDYNGAQTEGFGRAQFTIRNGRRSSSAAAFIRPAMTRPNLTVETHAHASRVLLEGTRAVGVAYIKGGRAVQAMADGEVILSGGTFNSPQLLMLSGIGPADHLREFGIDTVVDLPVGRNLQDHQVVTLQYARPTDPSQFRDQMRFDRMAVAMVRAWLFGTGPGTVVPGGLHAFVKSDPALDVPDIEFMFRGLPLEAQLWFPGIKARYPDGFGIRPAILHPESRGEVKLRSADPRDHVRIFYNFFSAPNDLPRLRNGVRMAREVAAQAPLARYRGEEMRPGPDVASDEAIDAFIRDTVATVEHPIGTCPMGDGPDAVLDPELRVKGVEKLRVVDASAMPDLVSAHTNACVLMMGEKASDMICGRDPLPAANVP